jgi:hypothetical protein
LGFTTDIQSHRKTIADYQKLKKEIAPRLVFKARGALSYGKLGLRLKCERSFLWKIEHGQKSISDELLLKVPDIVEEMENGQTALL